MTLAQRVALLIIEDLNIGAIQIEGQYVFPVNIRNSHELAVKAIKALAR